MQVACDVIYLCILINNQQTKIIQTFQEYSVILKCIIVAYSRKKLP